MPQCLRLKPRNYLAIILATTIVLFGGTSVLRFLLNSDNQVETTSSTAKINTSVITKIAALGRLQPQGEVIRISAPTSAEFDKRLAKLFVKEGDKVKVGDVIAVIDIFSNRKVALERAKQLVKIAQARLDRVKAGAKAGEISAQKAIIARLRTQLSGEISAKQVSIARLQAQLSGEISVKQASIARIQAELENAQIECRRAEQLYSNDVIATSNRDNKCLQPVAVREQLNEIKAHRNLSKQTLQEQIREAKINHERTINSLREQIKTETAILDKITEIRPVDVAVAQAELDNALSAVKQAEVELETSNVRSPINAKVLKIHTQPGEIIDRNGIAELGQTEYMNVMAEVYETDINKVKIGQKATIISDVLDSEMQGSVTHIGHKISKQNVLNNNPTADVDNRVIEVKISLNKEDSRRVSNFTNLQVKVLITY